MSSPQVRVRLSPEGTRQVIDSLRQVQREGDRANRGAARGVGLVNESLRELRRLAPAIGLAAVVTGMVAMTRNALLAADEMGRLAAITASSTENLSAFRHEAETLGGASVSDVRIGLVSLAQNLERLRQQAPATVRAFRGIGLSIEDFVGLDTVEATEKVAQALMRIEDPARRVAVAKNVLGESGARLMPTLQNLATKGLAGVRAEAEALGIVIDQDLANAATAANVSLARMREQLRGLGIAFAGELAPYIVQAMGSLEDNVRGKGGESMQWFGRVTGRVLGLVINLLRLFLTVARTTFEWFGHGLASTMAALNQAVRGNLRAAYGILQDADRHMRDTIASGWAETKETLAKLLDDLANDPPDVEVPIRPTADPAEFSSAIDDALLKARADARRRAIETEVQLLRALLENEQAENDRAYERGLKSLEDYLAERVGLIREQADIELNALALQKAALEEALDLSPPDTDAERIKALQEIGAVDTQIRLRQLKLARDLADAEDDRIDRQQRIADEQAKLSNTLADLEGRRHETFERNLEAELRQLRELGRRAGQTATEIEALAERLANARRNQFNFEQVARDGERALAAFHRDAELIRRDAEAGITSQLEGERRLIELQRQRLEVLQQMAAAARAAAESTGDPEAIARAQQFADSVDQIAMSFDLATNRAVALRSAAIDAFESGLAALLTNIDQVRSLEDAFRSLARTVAQTMARIASEILARQAVMALLNAWGGGGAGAAAAAAARYGGRIKGYAGGGDVRGPRLPIPGPDKIPIMAQEGEFMLRRSRVMEPGALDFLRRWNAGAFSLRQALSRPRFAAGGLIGRAAPIGDDERAAGGGEGRLRIINQVGDRVVLDAMNTAAGEAVVWNHIERNAERLERLGGSSR